MGDATRIVAVLAIMTLACAGQCAIPGTEDFETAIVPATAPGSCSAAGGLPAGWTNDPAASNTWTPWSGSTPSSGVGPAGDHSTGNGIYLYCEGSGCINYTAILNAPCVDMSAVVAPTVEFWAHLNGSGIVSLQCQQFDGTSWNTVWSMGGNQGNQWIFASAALAPVAGQSDLRFVAQGLDWTADIAIDDVKVGEPSGNEWQVKQPGFGIDVNGVQTIGVSNPEIATPKASRRKFCQFLKNFLTKMQ